MTAIALTRDRRLQLPGPGRFWIAGVVALAVALYAAFHDQFTLPFDTDAPIFQTLNGVRDWVDANRATSPIFVLVFDAIREGIGALVDIMLGVLHGLSWPGVVAAAGGLGYLAGGWRIGLPAALGFVSFGVLGLWDDSLDTLGLILAAVLLSLLIGIPLGIVAGRSDRFAALITPVLDVMQIMPTFAYLAPLVLLFLIGTPAATIATLIYAIPPAIRITALGIREVPPASVEAAVALGGTRWQVLRMVQLPLARRVVGLAINQTIMMAVGMVVITALIAAPGLGSDIIRALARVDTGAAFDAGIAIVILAIVLDRVTFHAGERFGARPGAVVGPAGSEMRPAWRRLVAPLAIGFTALVVVAGQAVAGSAFPDAVSFSFREPVNAVSGWIETNLYWLTSGMKNVFTDLLLNPLQGLLTSAPWWLIVGLVVVTALRLSGMRAAITAGASLALVAALSLWSHSMETLATVIVATILTLLIGVALGILAARRDRFASVLRPLLDAAQTMPSLVYLLPALALFGATRFTAIVASVIYAAPPVIRLVESGIRGVSPTVVEAATAAGANPRQLLLKVQLPLARRSLLVAANQGVVMVLAMVVVGGLVGAGGLGFDVVVGFSQRPDFGMGLAAGLCLVLLGITVDRITQGAGERRERNFTTG